MRDHHAKGGNKAGKVDALAVKGWFGHGSVR
jgi:hypothetical protein